MVSDSRGSVFAGEGLDLSALLDHKEKTGSVMDFSGARNVTKEELLVLDLDNLIPAAFENVITIDNSIRVKARLIVEFADGPVTGDADVLLQVRGIPILPDILFKGGGVIVSYLEMGQNFNLDHCDGKEVQAWLEKKMVDAYRGGSCSCVRKQCPDAPGRVFHCSREGGNCNEISRLGLNRSRRMVGRQWQIL